ncbi:MAG: penicillin acylase family protein [Sphingobacteriales bacterium]|nr:MAG: penicillin acylase family protein [Sphingobacteriales bacterium]
MIKSILSFTLSFFATILLIFLLNRTPADWPFIGKKLIGTPVAMLPPIGKFLDPFSGFWQNAEGLIPVLPSTQSLKALKAKVEVVFDERLVPHIYAQNEYDLYFVQGYVTASQRLWQMEFQTHAAAGRISEIVGINAIEFDREQRRKGMTYAAELLVEAMKSDTLVHNISNAYADGVNAYIRQLTYKNLPIEYKLLNYKPEPWSTLKSALLQKKMADDLTGNNSDIQLTNVAAVFGKSTADLLFPDFIEGQDPVIPAGTKWEFTPIEAKKPIVNTPDSTDTGCLFPINHQHLLPPQPQTEPTIGSNNWAISGSKTKSGKPILCNDPHLQLNLPSIWYETQLTAPGVNVYGVTIPGGPGIVIGFNSDIAWGVTNAGVDVKDYYKITFKDNTKSEYRYDNQWKETTKRIEPYKVRYESEAIQDTVIYTHLGPVSFEDYGPDNLYLAMKWKAHQPSNEFKTFYLLNRAKNYNDYEEALTWYECPAQNFVFADKNGDIAIWQKGSYPVRYKEQGKFILDGSNPDHEWQKYIPNDQTPHIRNPQRGFVSSANQHPTDSTYPYYYQSNDFEFYRNRRINNRLSEMKDITPTDLQQLQLDNFNLQASESLPIMLGYLNPDELEEGELPIYQTLKNWDFFNNPDALAPSFYEVFWQNLLNEIYDEFNNRTDSLSMVYPENAVTIGLMKRLPAHQLMDNLSTPETETLAELVRPAFTKSIVALTQWAIQNGKTSDWGSFKGTSILHLARIGAFSKTEVYCGGNYSIVNATGKRAGPSWRMVVAFTDNGVEAKGIYPGGQSGNPGSYNYTKFVDDWAKGEYYSLRFVPSSADFKAGEFVSLQNFIPSKNK